MLTTITPFDTTKHHIHLEFRLPHPATGRGQTFKGILDTGAPRTEFSDVVLRQIGVLDSDRHDVSIKPGLQTHKYGRVMLPRIEVCGQVLIDLDVMVSRFDNAWGIAALVGLDFFRRYKVTIDYRAGEILTEPYPAS